MGCILLAVFNRRIYKWFRERRKGGKYFSTGQTTWNIKQAFRLTDLILTSTTAIWAVFAFNSALSLYKSVSTMANQPVPEILRTVVNFYGQFIWPIFLFVLARKIAILMVPENTEKLHLALLSTFLLKTS